MNKNPITEGFEPVQKNDYEEILEVLKDLSLCVDEFGVAQSTHYVRDGNIEPKGSFIALCEHAREILKKLGE